MDEADDLPGGEPQGACAFPRIPEQVQADPLLLAVLHAVVFLQGSSSDVVDPQSADDAVDAMAGYLQRLEGKELDRLKTGLKNLAQFARQQKWQRDEIAFLEEFVAMFDLE